MRAADVQRFLREMGLPPRDEYGLPASEKRFPDGAHYRTEELPVSLDEYVRMFAVSRERGFAINRVTDVTGVMYDSDEEILTKLELCREHGCELIMGPGPGERPFDISQQAEIHQIVEGKVRGMDNVGYVLESMLRASELGCRGFLMYDEGVIMAALKMREDGWLPAETKFKISANISVSNAGGIKFWCDMLGPHDEINPVRDLTLPMIAAMRRVTANAFDLHIYHRNSVSRIMEAHEMVRVGAPLYLKNARSGPGVTVEERALLCLRAIEAIQGAMPEARQSKPFAEGLAIPAPRKG